MAGPSALGAIEYAPETDFAEDSSTFDAHRVPVLGMVDCSGLTWEKQDSQRVEQYRQGGSQWVKMGQGGSFKFKIDLTGHGTSTAGSPTVDALETLWGYTLGNVSASLPASTTLTGGTATVPTTTASGTFTAGALARIGTLGDGRGNGQLYAIGSHATTNLTLLTDLDDAPNNGDVLAGATMMYPGSTPSAGLNGTTPGLRFRLLTNNLQYACHGCFPTAVAFSGLSAGERPQAEITWQVARWSAVSATFPSALTSNQYNPAPVAAGSFFIANVGTTTRTKRDVRNFQIEYTLGMVPLLGPGGVGAYQSVIGCRRTIDQIKLSWTQDADASATATPTAQTDGEGTTSKHILVTLSTTPGSMVGFYFPKFCQTNIPVQFDDGGINRVRVEGMAYTGGTSTSELTLSAMRMAFC